MPSIGTWTWFRLAAKAAFAFGLGIGTSQTADALYDVKPGEIAGKPGSIIRVWPLEGGGPGGGDAFRILYRPTVLNGQPIVRAARALPRTGASNRFAVWGHSQGGHASLYTGELAASYAPELKLVGVAAAAPATYLAELFDADKTTSTGKELTAMTIYSWSKLYNIPISNLVEPAATRPYQAMAHDCIESLSEFAAIEKAAKPLAQVQFLKADPTEIEPWRGIMQKNTPGQAPAGAPVFIAQGTADTTVRPEITKQFARHLCQQGTRVRFLLLPGVSHTFAARNSAGQALAWMSDRFRGAPAPSDCGR